MSINSFEQLQLKSTTVSALLCSFHCNVKTVVIQIKNCMFLLGLFVISEVMTGPS